MYEVSVAARAVLAHPLWEGAIKRARGFRRGTVTGKKLVGHRPMFPSPLIDSI